MFKIFEVNPALRTTNPFQVNTNSADKDFAKNSFTFGNANPNRPESRDDIHGKFLYCLG